MLLDVYARGDITLLAKGGAYNRLQWEDLTVGQALALAGMSQSQANLQAVDPATLLAQGAPPQLPPPPRLCSPQLGKW